MDQQKIGKFISECRKEKGMTQIELANKIGITVELFQIMRQEEECPIYQLLNHYVRS